MCEQSVRQCASASERDRGFGNLCVQATTEFWLFQHTCNLTRESYIGLVCVINVCAMCTAQNTYRVVCITTQVIELKSWALDAKFGMRVTQLNFTYIRTYCYVTTASEISIVFSLIFMCGCKHTQTDVKTQQNKILGKKRIQINVTHDWEKLQHHFLHDQIIICRSDATYAHTSKQTNIFNAMSIHPYPADCHSHTLAPPPLATSSDAPERLVFWWNEWN